MGCNSTLVGKLQRVQNMAARLVTGCTMRDHITPVLQDLHWLPVRARIEYSILVFIFKAQKGLAPGYIIELVKEYSPQRIQRGLFPETLVTPKSKTGTYGGHSFSITGPKLWNELPIELRSTKELSVFKSRLKTHLFRMFYQTWSQLFSALSFMKGSL